MLFPKVAKIENRTGGNVDVNGSKFKDGETIRIQESDLRLPYIVSYMKINVRGQETYEKIARFLDVEIMQIKHWHLDLTGLHVGKATQSKKKSNWLWFACCSKSLLPEVPGGLVLGASCTS